MTIDLYRHWLPDVSRETLDKLSGLVELLVKWNQKINLIGRSTEALIWDRHVKDSVQIFNLAPNGLRVWADLGSGGGLPGLVVAVLLAETQPDCRMHLVESDLRKATFLREAVRLLGLHAQVHSARIEALPSLGADVVSARALAPLADLCGFALRHLADQGISIFPKGERWKSEVDLARKEWDFALEAVPSSTAEHSAVLVLKGIRHV